MVFPIVGGTQSTGYEISNSLRLNDDDGSYFYKTIGNANTGEDNATLSFWFKLGNIKTANNGGTIMTNGGASGYHVMQLYAQKIYIGSANFNIMFPNLIRDPSAWYHLFVAFDSSQGTNTNRVKAYLNGVLLTGATGFTDYPAQNENLGLVTNGNLIRIGSRGNTGDEAFDGYLAEFHYLDGTTKAYTDFGEFNDNGVWIPIEYTGGSYGNNGFYFKWEDSGALGTDSSSNADNFTPSGFDAQNSTTDTPTNNFATMIPAPNLTISEGNLNFTHNRTSNWDGTTASMGVQNGKWYYEAKLTSTDASPRHNIGFAGNPETWTVVVDGKGGGSDPTSNMTNAYWFHSNTNSAGYLNKTNTYGSNVSQWGIASGDIVGVALDMDNQKIYFHKNGTYYGADGNSSDPTNGTNPAYSSITTGIHYRPFLMLRNDGSETNTISMNFGNPVYSISSGNADANGYGNFEYAPPSGYYSLCTKNLAEYG